jgi:hypothetical protein
MAAQHVTGETLPDYAKWFLPARYADPEYQAVMAGWNSLVGQL